VNGAINWHDLEVFHTVLELGSFSGAARHLGLSQPTVSRRIEALERSLGKELFTRTATGLEASEIALAMAEHAGQMSAGMYGIQRVLAGTEDKPTGLVTFNLPHAIGSIPLLRSFNDFHQHYPHITIDLKSGPPQVNLGRREADIGLQPIEPREPELITKCIGGIHYGLYASPDYLAKYGVPRTAKDLEQHFFPTTNTFVHTPHLKSLEQFGAQPKLIPFGCSDNIHLLHLMGAMGLTLTSQAIGLQIPGMQRVVPEYHFESPDLWMSMHSSLRRNARIRVVWDWVTEHLPRVCAATRAPQGNNP
jgi:DNA-binding transcriptional LysR family regulator